MHKTVCAKIHIQHFSAHKDEDVDNGCISVKHCVHIFKNKLSLSSY